MFLATARIALAFFLYSCIATAGAPAVYAQSVVAGDATIEGTIRDAQTGLGLPGVSILAVGRELATLSAGDGRFHLDHVPQLSLYNDNVYDKLFSTLVPLSQTGSGFINPAYLSQVTSTVAALCGAGAPQLLGLNGTFNVGQLRARGFLLNGRQRLDRSTFIDYDWTLDSTVLVSAPTALLQSNVALIPGAQLAHLPLHTLDLALDHVLRHGFEARYSIHTVSANNTKSLPAYSYSDLHLNAPFGPGTFSLGVTNLFNRDADIFGLRFEGVPLALNSFATAAAYAPFTGAAATERFGLPYRMITFSYLLRAR